jgi:hypothetical protein
MTAVFSAVAGGNLDCLMYLFEHGCPWPPAWLFKAATSLTARSRKCLEYAAEHPDSPSAETYTLAFTLKETFFGFEVIIKNDFSRSKPRFSGGSRYGPMC